ncbi:transposase [Streptomyces sp. NPDC000410]|uniref:transposase n=1 Tax=Streptomyces sp. NPDC000410 TaxID=3154254 RepID=UPI00331876AC
MGGRACHDSILSRNQVSTEPGTVHNGVPSPTRQHSTQHHQPWPKPHRPCPRFRVKTHCPQAPPDRPLGNRRRITRRPEHLTDVKRKRLEELRDRNPGLETTVEYARRLALMVRNRRSEHLALEAWTADVRLDGQRALRTLANGMRRDREPMATEPRSYARVRSCERIHRRERRVQERNSSSGKAPRDRTRCPTPPYPRRSQRYARPQQWITRGFL